MGNFGPIRENDGGYRVYLNPKTIATTCTPLTQ